MTSVTSFPPTPVVTEIRRVVTLYLTWVRKEWVSQSVGVRVWGCQVGVRVWGCRVGPGAGGVKGRPSEMVL